MALSARELVYFVRVQDQATRTLRRLGGDFAALSRAGTDFGSREVNLLNQRERIYQRIRTAEGSLQQLRTQGPIRIDERRNALAKEREKIEQRIANAQRTVAQTPGLIRAQQGRFVDINKQRFAAQRVIQTGTSEQVEQRLNQLLNQRTRIYRRIESSEGRIRTLGDQRFKLDTALTRLQLQQANLVRRRARPSTDTATINKQLAINRRDIIANRAAFTELGGTIAGVNQKLADQRLEYEQLGSAASRLNIQQGAIRQAERDLAKYNAQLTQVRTKIVSLSEAQVTANRTIREGAGDLERNAAATGQLAAQETELAAKIEAAQNRIKFLNVDLVRNTQLLRENAEAQRLARWDRVAAGGRILEHIGRSAQIAGVAVGAGLGYAAHAAANFNTQATLAATQVGRVDGSLNALGRQTTLVGRLIENGILRQMRQFPATSQEMTQSAYDIFSSLSFQGTAAQQTAKGMQILRLANKAAVAGMAPLADTTRALITIWNDFGGSNVRMVTLLNRAFAAVRFGRMTFREFTSTLGQAAPAAKAGSQSFTEMSGALAFLTRRIPNVRMASTAYARLIELFQRPELQHGLAAFGVQTRTSTGALRPLSAMITDIARKFPTLVRGRTSIIEFLKAVSRAGGSQSGFMGTAQARRALTFLVQQFGSYRTILGQTANDQNELAKSSKAMSQSTGVQFAVFVNNLRALGLEIGRAVIPTLLKLIQPLRNAFQAFNRLDPGRRNQIARWAAYAAAILLVAGTFLTIAGASMRLMSVWARLGVAQRVLIYGPVGLAAIVALLIATGHAADILNGAILQLTGSWEGWVATLGLVAVALLRVRASLLAVTATEGGAAGAGGLIGLIARIPRAVQTLGAGMGLVAENASSAAAAGGLFAGATAGAGAAFSLMNPVVLGIGAVVAATAGGLYLWRRHAQAARRDAELMRDAMRDVQRFVQAPGQAATRFGGIAGATSGLVDARNNFAEINQQLKDAAAAVKANPNDAAAMRNFNSLLQQRAAALSRLRTAQHAVNVDQNSFLTSIRQQGQLLGAIGSLEQRRRTLQGISDEIRRMNSGGDASGKIFADVERKMHALGLQHFDQVHSGLRRVKQELKDLGGQADTNDRTLRRAFGNYITYLQGILQLRQRIPRGAIDAALDVAIRRQTTRVPVIRATIEAYMSRRSLARAPRDIQRAVRVAKISADVTPAMSRLGGQLTRLFGVNMTPAQRQAQRVRQTLNQAFSRAIQQRIHLNIYGKKPRQLGADIVSGTAKGIRDNAPEITAAMLYSLDNAREVARRKWGMHSPSTLAANQIGKPVAQGMAKGVTDNKGVFSGAILDALAKGASTANGSKEAIGVPLVMGIAQGIRSRIPLLRRLSRNLSLTLFQGPHIQSMKKGQQANIQDLQRDLRQQYSLFVAFNQGLAKLHQRGIPKAMLTQLAQLGEQGAQYIRVLSRSSDPQLKAYVRLWKAAMDQIDGATARGGKKAASNLKSATEEAVNNLSRMYTQIHDELQGQFGELFSGPFMQSDRMQARIEWGNILRPQDLQRDLRSQVNQFETWRGQLGRLGRRGVPRSLLASLEALGPGAVDKLKVLNRMTPRQLRQYIAMWNRAQRDINNATMFRLQSQIREWRSYGRKAAMQFMRGVIDVSPAIRRQMLNLFRSWESGRNPRTPPNQQPPHHHRAATRHHANQPRATKTEYHDHTTIHAHHSESLDTTLARHRFRHRMRQRGHHGSH